MKHARMAFYAILVAPLISALASSPRAQTPAPASRPAKLADVAWLAGHWVGAAGENSTDEICSQPTNARILCMFHVSHAGKTLWVELYSMYDAPDGLVNQIRFFTPELQPLSTPAATFRVRITASGKTVFENTAGGGPKSLTVTRNGASGFTDHVEFIGPGGKSSFIDTVMRRATD